MVADSSAERPVGHWRFTLRQRHLTVIPGGALAVLLLIPVIVLPLLFLAYGSTLNTQSATAQGSATFVHFSQIAGNANYRLDLLHSIELAIATGLGAGVVGVTIAWIVVYVQPPGRSVIDALMIVPFFLSSLVLSIAWSSLGNPSNGLITGWISELIGHNVAPISVYSAPGIAFVLITATTPFVYILTAAALGAADPSLEEAAAMSGAKKFTRVRSITLPLVAPSILAGVFFAVVFALEAFAEPAVLGAAARYNTLMIDIYNTVETFPSQYGTASALAVVVMVMTIALVYAQRRLLGSRSFVSLTGKSGSSADISRGYSRRARLLLLAVPVVYLFVALILPYFSIVLTSLQAYISPDFNNLGLENYRSFFSGEGNLQALRNSAIAAAGAAIVSMVWMFVLAYLLRRLKFRGSSIIGYVASVPIAVPGIVMGVALLWLWLRSPIHIYGSLTLISVAYLAKYSPFVLQSVSATMTQLDASLEESARMSGAGQMRVLRDIILPLTRPALLSGGIIFALFALRDLNLVILLSGPNNTTMSVQIWGLYENGQFPEVAAASVVQSVVLLILFIAGRRLLRSPAAGRRSRQRSEVRSPSSRTGASLRPNGDRAVGLQIGKGA